MKISHVFISGLKGVARGMEITNLKVDEISKLKRESTKVSKEDSKGK